jgi:hypothetical protein
MADFGGGSRARRPAIGAHYRPSNSIAPDQGPNGRVVPSGAGVRHRGVLEGGKSEIGNRNADSLGVRGRTASTNLPSGNFCPKLRINTIWNGNIIAQSNPEFQFRMTKRMGDFVPVWNSQSELTSFRRRNRTENVYWKVESFLCHLRRLWAQGWTRCWEWGRWIDRGRMRWTNWRRNADSRLKVPSRKYN